MGGASLLLACLSLTLPDTLHYTLTFSLNELAFDSIGGEDLVTLRGCQPILKEGSPSLPRFPAVFVIPAGSRVGDCWGTVEQSSSINGTFSIWPAQPPFPISQTDSFPVVPPDSAIYNSNSAWPSTVCQPADVGAVDGTYLARVDVFPLTWNPNTGVLSLRTEIDISLEVIEDSIPAPDPVLMTDYFWDRRVEQLSALVLNSDDLEDFSIIPDIVPENDRGEGSAPIAVDCLILTPHAWASSWQPLIDWNIQRGLYTEILTLEDVEDGAGTIWGIGRDWPEMIRNCIRWQHENRGVQYVLLGADSRDPEESPDEPGSDIPARGCPDYFPPSSGLLTLANDWYYTCPDADLSWQTNGNETPWGQYHPTNPALNDEMDLSPDIFLGRIPVHSMLEVNTIAQKLVDYQQRLPSGCNPAIDLLIISANVDVVDTTVIPPIVFPQTWQHLAEVVSPVSGLFDRFWVAEEGCLQGPYEEISPDVVVGMLDGTYEHADGGAWRVNFGGHGGYNYIGANSEGNVGTAMVHPHHLREMTGSSGQFCTGWAFNCGTGQFWFADSDTSICETWLGTDSQSSDAPLGPSYVGNVYQGLNSPVVGASPSHMLNTWFLDALYNQQSAAGTRGQAVSFNQAKLMYIDQWLSFPPGDIPPPIEFAPNEEVEPMWDLLNANLLGDPACPLWLTEPLGMPVHHVSVVNAPAQFTVRVTDDDDQPLQGARVCLLLERSSSFLIYERGQTNSSGQFSVYLEPSSPGTMTVTVTKEGYLPYQGSVAVRV
ncbi:MAG: hypothetical protein GYA36_18425 [Veillonellaceae bacterium]|nr:hypothetical protein [Veillonellaceae bacterium]